MEDLKKYLINPELNLRTHKEYEDSKHSHEKVNDTFRSLVRNSVPFCAAKLGMVETMSLRRFLLGKTHNRLADYRQIAGLMFVNAGIFPPTQTEYDLFNETFISHLSDLDFFGMWMFGNEPEAVTEKEIYETYAKRAQLITAGSWDSFSSIFYGATNPWITELKGKEVLVISSFADTIEKQYEKREKIWDNPNILPEFKLRTIKCPLSAGLQKESPYVSWDSGLKEMKKMMEDSSFDVCYVGAGAWGLPLAVHAKRLGKIGIHSGGDTQLLFGIKGRRWDNNPLIQKSVNEHWVRPSKDETPNGKEFIENGCYW